MRVASIPVFQLRFPLSDTLYWADRYDYADDSEVEAIGRAARKQGFYSRDQFLRVTLWKTERSKSRCARNTAAAVKEVTWVALHATGERLRIGSLTLLEGVQMPTASVLLHLAHKQPYPILDYRALWSLGVHPAPPYYSFELWWAYTQECRALAEASGVAMRTLDRALWQYSNEHQEPRLGR